MAYNFNKKVIVGKFTIEVDEASRYGYFEHDEYGEGGGLWFGFAHDENGELTSDTRLHLEDYDGVSMLPKDVASGLEQLGYVVGEDFK